MKRVLVLVAFAVLVAGVAGAQTIVGSGHDLSTSNGGAYGEDEICIFCHTPHNALSTTVPLWNHADTAATFTVYDSTTMNTTMGQPAGISRACLSCHDGTVNVDAYGGGAGTAALTGAALLGTDLSNDHPVGISLAAAVADGDTELGGAQAFAQLFGGLVECASCHDVHNTANSYMLLVDNAVSALCLDCHSK